MPDDPMREIIDRRSREGEAVWNTSRLVAHLTRIGIQRSQSAGRFSPRRSLVGVKGPSPAPAEDPWPFLSGEL